MPALRRRGWLMRRLLLIADLVGLLSAFLLALALVSPESRGRSGQHSLGDRTLHREPPPLGAHRTHAWPLRSRRGANRPLDRRRHLRRPAGGLDRHLGLRGGHRDHRPASSGPHAPRRLLGDRDPARSAAPSDRASHGTPQRRVHPERHHRRVGSGCASACQQDREPSRVRTEDRRLRRSRRSGFAERRRATRPPRIDRRPTRAREGALGASSRNRVLDRLARADARGDPLDAGQRRSDRHRSPHVRGTGHERAAAHDRRHPVGGSAHSPTLRLRAIPQAFLRLSRRCGRARPPLTAPAHRLDLHRHRLPWSVSSSDRCAWVPRDARSMSSSSGRWCTMPSRERPKSRT